MIMVKVTLLNQSVYGNITPEGDYRSDSIPNLVDWLNEQLEEIPAEYRDSARVEIESVGGWEGEHHAEITITYERPETADEKAARHVRERARADEEERLAANRLADARARRERLAQEGGSS